MLVLSHLVEGLIFSFDIWLLVNLTWLLHSPRLHVHHPNKSAYIYRHTVGAIIIHRYIVQSKAS
jgi:hypothetical protein